MPEPTDDTDAEMSMVSKWLWRLLRRANLSRLPVQIPWGNGPDGEASGPDGPWELLALLGVLVLVLVAVLTVGSLVPSCEPMIEPGISAPEF